MHPLTIQTDFSLLQWEELERRTQSNQGSDFTFVVRRAPVPEGWLVHSFRERTCYDAERDEEHPIGVGEGNALTFVPDQSHRWMAPLNDQPQGFAKESNELPRDSKVVGRTSPPIKVRVAPNKPDEAP